MNTSKEERDQRIADKNYKRFEKHQRYIIEKLDEDLFVSRALLRSMEDFKAYLRNPDTIFTDADEIRIIDIGPAHGAIGTIFSLIILNEFKLLDKVSVFLIDPVKEVVAESRQAEYKYYDDAIEKIYYHIYREYIPIEKKDILIKDIKKIMMNAEGEVANIENSNVANQHESFDIAICTFTLHHIHPDYKTQALEVVINILKTKGFLVFCDEWFQEQYFERFLLGRDRLKDPIPYEFPESPEDLIDRLQQRISIFKVEYDGYEAFHLSGVKRRKENKELTGNYPDNDFKNLGI